MGRPPLNMKSMNLRLPKEISGRIESLVGKRRKAGFIREAIERELERREPPKKSTK